MTPAEMGRKGGRTAMAKKSPAELSQFQRDAARARWAKHKQETLQLQEAAGVPVEGVPGPVVTAQSGE